MDMFWLLLTSLISSTQVNADQFNTPTNQAINNFIIENSNFYVATPSNTYLLNSSLDIVHEFTKNFNESRVLYVDSNILFECGVRRNVSKDACCFVTNSTDLVQLSSNSSEKLCSQFKKMRYQYPWKAETDFCLLTSYYVQSKINTGSFTRLRFSNMFTRHELSFTNFQFNNKISLEFRAQVVSPAVGKLGKYVVLMQSIIKPDGHYMDPDIGIHEQNLIAKLICDEDNQNVSLGFAITNMTEMTHYVMYKSKIKGSDKFVNYRICSFTEGTDMHVDDEGERLVDISKLSLFNIKTDGQDIKALNGIVVNGGIVVFYSVGGDLHKLVKTKAESQLRLQGKVHTTSEDIKKIQFMSENLGYVSSDSVITSFTPHTCGEQTSCMSCTQLRDPYCGWCTLENRCTVKSQCTIFDNLWTQENTKCLAISVDDSSNDVMAGQNLVLLAKNMDLPQDIVFTCRFTSTISDELRSNGTYENEEITCSVPVITNKSKGLTAVDVSVYYLSAEIGSAKIKYHQCDLYDKCSDCSIVGQLCTWCPLDGKCSVKEEAVCEEYKVEDSTKCPVMTTITPKTVSNDAIKQVIINVTFLPEYQVASVYQCKITSKMNSTHSRYFDIDEVDSTNSSIFCKDVQIGKEFPEYNMPEMNLGISIVYRGASVQSAPVDVVTGNLGVYSCELLASDCVQCISVYSVEPYSCRFCTDQCAYTNSAQCDSSSVTNVDKCFGDNTEIKEVTPNWSPGEGGVSISIKGKSLAKDNSQITIKFVFVNNPIGTPNSVDCTNSAVQNSTTLSCTTPDIMTEFKMVSMYDQEFRAKITLDYLNSGISPYDSDKLFTFAPLDIFDVSPLYGPKSGGTSIAINGSRICVPYQTVTTINGKDCTNIRCDKSAQVLHCETPVGQGEDSNVSVTLGNSTVTDNDFKFSYRDDPVVTSVRPNCTLAEGGMNITVTGSNFNLIQLPLLLVKLPSDTPTSKRSVGDTNGNGDTPISEDATNDDVINLPVSCGDEKTGFVGTSVRPVLVSDTQLVFTMPAKLSTSYQYGFKMDNVEALCTSLRTMEVVTDPSVISQNFLNNNTLTCSTGKPCYVNITMTQIHRFKDQVSVIVGKMPCLNATISTISKKAGQIGDIGRFVCVVPSVEEIKDSFYDQSRLKRAILGDEETAKFPVHLQIGRYRKDIGWLVFVEKGFPLIYIYIGSGVAIIFIMIFIILVVKNRKDKNHMMDLEKKHQKEIDKVEASYTNTARQEFTELTLMTNHTAQIKIDPLEIPYRIFSDYLVHIMFPNVDKKKIISNLQLDQCEIPDYQLQEFIRFLKNEHFVVKFIDVIERQREFQIAHRCEVASYLTIALYSDFNYLSHILFLLLDKIIAADVHKSPKLLLRATKSVAEKLLTNWLSLALQNYLYTITGPPLYELCFKINRTVELGPLDFVTHQARFALSQDRILSEKMEYKVLEVEAEGPDGSRSKNPVPVLDCDTITQVKGKLYRAIYNHQPFSQQPSLEALSLLWLPAGGQGPGNMELSDFDDRMTEASLEKQFNTLKTYKVASKDMLKLTLFNDYHIAPMSTIRSTKRQTVSEVCRSHLVKGGNNEMDFRSPAPNKRNTNTVTTTKIASEAFLPSLIRTKEHLSEVLQTLIGTIFMESNNIPAAIKYLFDYLDDKTILLSERDRGDPEIAHVWKTNSLPLRFWINILKNPQFLFDIEKPPIMDSYLSVIGQCFMDSFSLATMTLNKDSSANKLVYNREVNIFRSKVDKWYKDVRQAPQVSIRTVTAESKLPTKLPFGSKFAVSQLFKYAQKYHTDIAASLPTQGQSITRSDFEVLMKPL